MDEPQFTAEWSQFDDVDEFEEENSKNGAAKMQMITTDAKRTDILSKRHSDSPLSKGGFNFNSFEC